MSDNVFREDGLVRGPDDWRVGDMAFISGEPTGGDYSKGDIVRVCWISKNGPPLTRCGIHLLTSSNRQPLRVLTVEEIKALHDCGRKALVKPIWPGAGKVEFLVVEAVRAELRYALVSLPDGYHPTPADPVIEARRELEEAQRMIERAEKRLAQIGGDA